MDTARLGRRQGLEDIYLIPQSPARFITVKNTLDSSFLYAQRACGSQPGLFRSMKPCPMTSQPVPEKRRSYEWLCSMKLKTGLLVQKKGIRFHSENPRCHQSLSLGIPLSPPFVYPSRFPLNVSLSFCAPPLIPDAIGVPTLETAAVDRPSAGV